MAPVQKNNSGGKPTKDSRKNWLIARQIGEIKTLPHESWKYCKTNGKRLGYPHIMKYTKGVKNGDQSYFSRADH